MTSPAASGPIYPFARIKRVDARLSDRRYIVVISKTSGKALNSVGFSIKMAIIKTMQDIVIEKASRTSNNHDGSGIIKITNIKMIAKAKKMSPRLVAPINISLKLLPLNIFCGCLAIFVSYPTKREYQNPRPDIV